MGHPQDSQKRHLLLGTVSFTVCFAAWGLISAFAPRFRQQFHLSATQTAFLVAVPVLLGALARIPMGMLADRFGGRTVFTVLMFFVALPVILVPSKPATRICSLWRSFWEWRGLPLRSASDTSRAGSAGEQGSALGVYGLGNIGQSAAVFLGPVIAAAYGLAACFLGMAIMLLAWAIVFAIFGAQRSPGCPSQRLGRCSACSRANALSWALSAFYFLTFGGFVAFSIYLPTLLKDQFHLAPADAGFRTAGFVVLATLCVRSAAGSRTGSAARACCQWFFRSWLRFACCSRGRRWCHSRSVRWVARLLLGVGNGAVSSLVPQYFPRQPATVTGLVGRNGRDGRILSASAARLFPRSAGSGLAGLRSAVGCAPVLCGG